MVPVCFFARLYVRLSGGDGKAFPGSLFRTDFRVSEK